MEKPGELIKKQRNKLGLSQEELGDLVGYRQTTISDWERGKIGQIRKVNIVADALKIPRDVFARSLADEVGRRPHTKRINPKIRETMESGSKHAQESIVAKYQNVAANIRIADAPIAGVRDVPVFGVAHGGDSGVFEFNGQILGYEMRPPVLDGVREAYAVYVDGSSMYPRYKPGETVWINPNRPPKREDDVIVQLFSDDPDMPPLGFIKEFVAWTGSSLIVRQHNPGQEIKYPRERVKSVHIIVFSQRST